MALARKEISGYQFGLPGVLVIALRDLARSAKVAPLPQTSTTKTMRKPHQHPKKGGGGLQSKIISRMGSQLSMFIGAIGMLSGWVTTESDREGDLELALGPSEGAVPDSEGAFLIPR